MADTATSTTATWLETLQQTADALSKELLCVERRYHGRVVEKEPDGGVRMQCFISLSDPDLPSQFKGESQLQLTFPAKYPAEPVRIDLESWHHRMTSAQFTALASAVEARARELCGTYSIRKLLTWLDNNVCRLLQDLAPLPPDKAPVKELEAPVSDEKQAEDEAHNDTAATKKKCRFFARGECKSGEQCRFAHTIKEDPKKPKKAKKKKQTTPANNESQEEPATSLVEAVDVATTTTEAIAKPPTPAKKKKAEGRKRPCKFYAKGACRDGEQCKFSHQDKQQSTSTVASTQKKKTGIVITVIGDPLPTNNEDSIADEAPPPPVVPVPSAEDWTAEQQRSLDAALKKYPPTMDKKERWTSIAADVNGKSLNDCIDRFKLISELVKNGGTIPIAPPRSPPIATLKSPPSPVQLPRETTPAIDTSTTIESTANAKIIPPDQRVAIETEPEANGASVLRLDELFLYQIGTVIPHRVVCQVQCAHCPLKFDATLSLASASLQKWCPRCSAKHWLLLRPTFTHSHSNVLAYIDSEHCAVVDVLPSDLLASCLECGQEALVEGVVPGRRAEQSCFACHTKLAIMTKRYSVSGASIEAATTTSAPASKQKSKRPTETFVLGQPLPNKGACDHYKHSYRWFRFQCCGKAFPCDVCHDSSDCSEANTGKFASKTICGFCSKEQASTVKECACGNTLGRSVNRSRHWEGGQGCRDQTLMSTTDKHKFRGHNKTESQKAKRVGLAGKLRTERVIR